jgi:hypothetical protein
MKSRWLEHDREADRRGLAVDRTIGSTNARKTWFQLLDRVIGDGQVIRVRHRYFDEPVLLLKESLFRDLELTAPPLPHSDPPLEPIEHNFPKPKDL